MQYIIQKKLISQISPNLRRQQNQGSVTDTPCLYLFFLFFCLIYQLSSSHLSSNHRMFFTITRTLSLIVFFPQTQIPLTLLKIFICTVTFVRYKRQIDFKEGTLSSFLSCVLSSIEYNKLHLPCKTIYKSIEHFEFNLKTCPLWKASSLNY